MARAAAIEPDNPSTYRGGSGEPLVLVHGGGGTPRLWRTTIPLLEPHHDVLAVTLAGHFGGSEIRRGGATLEALVAAVEADMDEAGFDTAHVAGGSLGAWVALELGRRGRARSVVAIAPAGGWERGSREVRRVVWIYRTLLTGSRLLGRFAHLVAGRPRLRRLAAWHHFAHPERISPDDFEYMIAAVGAPGLLEGLAWALTAPGAENLHEITCPVLLAFPETDHILPRPRYGERIVKAIPHAEVVELPGVGHAAMVDDPELVARTIVVFAARHAAAQPAGVAER
ncbi:MAG: alpha/beta fold hydrolase [Actinobacteria bacterium]|nr:MAG: alpha/beta fold hydrolase [Actinomycetota bacterium]